MSYLILFVGVLGWGMNLMKVTWNLRYLCFPKMASFNFYFAEDDSLPPAKI